MRINIYFFIFWWTKCWWEQVFLVLRGCSCICECVCACLSDYITLKGVSACLFLQENFYQSAFNIRHKRAWFLYVKNFYLYLELQKIRLSDYAFWKPWYKMVYFWSYRPESICYVNIWQKLHVCCCVSCRAVMWLHNNVVTSLSPLHFHPSTCRQLRTSCFRLFQVSICPAGLDQKPQHLEMLSEAVS